MNYENFTDKGLQMMHDAIHKAIAADSEAMKRGALGPQAEAYLPLFWPREKEAIEPENMMEMKIKWRFAQPRIWRVDRSIPVAIRKRDQENLINGYRKAE
jgi:hypothetical protein